MDDSIFLDTSFIIAYYNSRDENHNKAETIMKKVLNNKNEIIINDYIFDECANVLLIRLKNFGKVLEICGDLKKLKIINVNEFLFEESWEIFKKQNKTRLSFTDSTILSTMKNRKIKNLVTFDKDFEKILKINILK